MEPPGWLLIIESTSFHPNHATPKDYRLIQTIAVLRDFQDLGRLSEPGGASVRNKKGASRMPARRFCGEQEACGAFDASIGVGRQ
jgi:hypothetical protein